MTREPYLIGCARVSKGDDQSNAAQRRALDAAGCKRVFEETASGGRWDRPKLLEMIGQLRDGDVVVVWKLDRLSRSLKDMMHIMERIELAGELGRAACREKMCQDGEISGVAVPHTK